MKIFYSRVSSVDGSQNHDRQLVNTDDFDYVITDNFTGNSDLFERPKGKEIKKLLDQGKLTHLEVHSIDRLGRNLLSVLNTWKELTADEINRLPLPNYQDYNFEVKMPTTDNISAYLVSNYGFTRIESQNVVLTIQL